MFDVAVHPTHILPTNGFDKFFIENSIISFFYYIHSRIHVFIVNLSIYNIQFNKIGYDSTLYALIPQNGRTHSNNSSAIANSTHWLS